MKKILSALVLSALACASSEETLDNKIEARTQALTESITGPFGDSPVNLYVGWTTDDFFQWALFKRQSDGACNWVKLGGAGGLTNSVSILTGAYGAANDYISVIRVNGSASVTCPSGTVYEFRPLKNFGGWFVDIAGGHGDDYFDCGAPGEGPVTCYGQQGNDYMVAWDPFSRLQGGDNDDTLVSIVPPASARYVSMKGGNGNDCLALPLNGPAPMIFDCGEGAPNDRSTIALGAHCSYVTGTCP
jgi:hypothetical protein